MTNDSLSSLAITFTIVNTDSYNALEIGALGFPLCFQVQPEHAEAGPHSLHSL